MSQALYRKWRPRRWDQVVGQDHVVRTLHHAVAADRVAHAYLFAGPRGTGKTTTARLLAKAVNCLDEALEERPCDNCAHCLAINEGRFLDLIEIDAASNTSVDDVRDLREKINFAPNRGRFKVYIVDEVHMLSTAAFNALLKTLEEPPPHAIFILATTEVHKIPATVLSRCQRHEFRRIPVAEILAQLEVLVAGEGYVVEPEALDLVARQATGSLRDAISLLDQLASTGQEITLARTQLVLGTAASQAVLDVVDALLAREASQGLDQIHATLDGGSDPRQFARQMVDYLRQVLLVRMGNSSQIEATPEIKARMVAHSQGFDVAQLLGVIRAFNQAAVEARLAWQPALPLEVALIESLQALEAEAAQPSPARVAESASPVPTSPGPAKTTAAPPDSGEQAAAPVQAENVEVDGDKPLNRVHQAWPQVLALTRQQNPQTQGLLNSCKPLGFKGKDLILGFASELLKSKMEKPDNLDIARQALSEALGTEVGIRCVVSDFAPGGRGSGLPDVDSEGMVAVALRDLGGEIVDIQ